MKILVIGSKGFIGEHVVKHYRNTEADLYTADIVTDYVEKKYFQIDSTNGDFLTIFQEHQFDFCINCSGAASVPESLINPARDFNLNTYNVLKLLDAVKKHNATCKIINLSSAAVYGNPVNLPVREDQMLLPVSPYGFHKKITEEIIYEYHKMFGVQAVSLRIFSAYGPGLKKQLLWDVIQKSLNTSQITLFGTGHETRDYIYIDDIVQCIDLIVKKGDFRAMVYNLANGIEISTQIIAEKILKLLDYKGELKFNLENRVGDPLNWKADITKIQKLGYRQSTNIQEGLKNYVEWFQELK